MNLKMLRLHYNIAEALRRTRPGLAHCNLAEPALACLCASLPHVYRICENYICSLQSEEPDLADSIL